MDHFDVTAQRKEGYSPALLCQYSAGHYDFCLLQLLTRSVRAWKNQVGRQIILSGRSPLSLAEKAEALQAGNTEDKKILHV